ncbi:hypothetical protein ACR777_09235 [Sphingobacterium spiritivorum]|uniref:hypothetical protein n=1 Tax=Sphingobacterium spiritivorum TaxID=258 RepID=UPI003DA4AC6A
MPVIFISYADKRMAYSLKRIGKQAEKLGIFDEVLLYTPETLPHYIKSSPLMQYERGGGYWAWKPAIIWDVLQKYEDGSLLVYADAGCSLYKSEDWSYYFGLLKQYHSICFEYKDQMPDWKQFGQTSTKIKYWTKNKTLLYFNKLLGTDYSEKYNKIWGGAILCTRQDNPFIKEWLDITLNQPELIIDPTEEELLTESDFLIDHKHDQSVITPLAHLFPDVLVLEEKAETSLKAAIVASRIRARDYRQYLNLMLKQKMRSLFGADLYNKIKKRIK